MFVKPAFCICKNKDADHLYGNRAADQRLCFCYNLIVQLILQNFKPLATFCGCTAWLMSDLVGNPEDRFSLDKAHFIFYMSRVVRKPDFCICENKDADQLHGEREADQRLCFHYTDSTIPILPTSEISSL